MLSSPQLLAILYGKSYPPIERRCPIPELAEIAHYCNDLQPLIQIQILIDIEVLSGRYQRHPETWHVRLNYPSQNQSLETKGKLLIWNLDHNQHLFFKHGMTGKWSLKSEPHNHLQFH